MSHASSAGWNVRRVDAAGISWCLREAGSGPVTLLLHGTGSSGRSFDALRDDLAPHTTLLAPDLPGHADSRPAAGFTPSLRSMARALTDLLTTLDAKPTLVVGHSAGVAVAARMLLDGRLSPTRLVGLAPALLPFRGLARVVFPASAQILAGSPLAARAIARRNRRRSRVQRILEGTGSHPSSASVDHYHQLAQSADHVASVLAMMAAWDLEPLHAALPQLTIPTVLLAGARDRAVPVAQIRAAARRIPNATVHVVADAGHLLHEELPARILPHLLTALAAP